MKILQVLHNFPPEFAGGVERAVQSLAEGLQALGHELVIACGSEVAGERAQIVAERFASLDVRRLHRGPGRFDPIEPWSLAADELYAQVLHEVQPDLVHVHHHWNLGEDLVRRAAACGLPTVLTLHDFFTSCPLFFRVPDGQTPCEATPGAQACAPCAGAHFGVPAEWLGPGLERRALGMRAEAEAADLVLAPSETHARDAARLLGLSRPVEALPLGSAERLAPPRPERVAALRVLHFGHASALKGSDFLARALRELRGEGHPIELVLAGGSVGPALDLEGAQQIGSYTAEQLVELAGKADLAAFPSLARESYGLVVDEALRLGLPVLVSDRGALGERLGGRGRVLPAGDLEAWKACLREIASDAASLANWNAATVGSLCTPSQHALRTQAHYEALLARSSRAGIGEAKQRAALLAERLGAARAREDLLIGAMAARAPAPVPAAEEEEMAAHDPLEFRTTVQLTLPAEAIDRSGRRVSVITRTRNRPLWLQQAVASVAGQTHSDVQLVVVNDGGEPVDEVLQPFRSGLDITLLDTGGVGRCRAGNLGLGAAQGRYIAWLDDDDLYHPEHLATLVEAIGKGGAGLVYSDAERIDCRVESDGSLTETGRSIPFQEDFSRLGLLRQCYIHLVMVLHERECFESLGGMDETLEVLEDWDLFFRFAQDYEFRRVPRVTAGFRIRDDKSNAVTALRDEFARTRSRLNLRYLHLAFPELVGRLMEGEGHLGALHDRVRALEEDAPGKGC